MKVKVCVCGGVHKHDLFNFFSLHLKHILGVFEKMTSSPDVCLPRSFWEKFFSRLWLTSFCHFLINSDHLHPPSLSQLRKWNLFQKYKWVTSYSLQSFSHFTSSLSLLFDIVLSVFILYHNPKNGQTSSDPHNFFRVFVCVLCVCTCQGRYFWTGTGYSENSWRTAKPH